MARALPKNSAPILNEAAVRKYKDSQVFIMYIYSDMWMSLYKHKEQCKCVSHNSVYITNKTPLQKNWVLPIWTMHVRSYLFWHVTQCWKVVSYRRFGTAHRPHLQGSSIWDSLTRMWPKKTGPKRWWLTTHMHCITCQKSEDLIYSVAEAGSLTITNVFLQMKKWLCGDLLKIHVKEFISRYDNLHKHKQILLIL